ncbi:MAG: dTDP-4-dehydrorhamnose reductase [Thermomicrobiaceae bacterium]
MNLLVTGGTGQLGRALSTLGSHHHQITAPGSSALDVTDFLQVHDAIAEVQPDLVIHAGAMTDVDGCEQFLQLAHRVNAIGTQNIASTAARFGIPIVYISTNFVFDGSIARPYLEFDTPAPISVYGATKLAGERAVSSLNPQHYIVRTSMVYDETGRNFVNSMLRLAGEHPKLTVVDDQYGNPTYAGDLAFGILRLIEQPSYGIYHLTNAGSASWYEWAVRIFELSGIDIPVKPIPASQFPRAATPPAIGVLDNLSASSLGIELPDWEDALERCLTSRNEPAG